MLRARIDRKGRVSIPAELRRELGLKEDQEVFVERDGGRLILRRPTPVIRFGDSRGGWRRRPVISAKEALGGP